MTILLAAFLTACNSEGLQPRSGGRLYEVLVVGDTNHIVSQTLGTDVAALPQSEPEFDVSSISRNRFSSALRLSRNIVKADINPHLYTSVKIRYEKNVYARPQMVVSVEAPSVPALQQAMKGKQGELLRQLLRRSELNFSISQLRNKRNIKMEQNVRSMFGISLWVPLDMTSCHQGDRFLWISNNSPTAMQNLVIYQLKGRPLEITGRNLPHCFTTLRDSVMKKNIKGETNDMYMQTAGVPVIMSMSHEKGRRLLTFKGLWEVKNDAMGGPFISHVIQRDGNTLVVEAFIFAPGKKKRNYLRQTEAALYTLK